VSTLEGHGRTQFALDGVIIKDVAILTCSAAVVIALVGAEEVDLVSVVGVGWGVGAGGVRRGRCGWRKGVVGRDGHGDDGPLFHLPQASSAVE
jgi:hypothetical protein